MDDKKLGFGCMRLPSLDAKDESKVDIELLKKMVDAYIDRGFTYFDTAWMYCGFQSENAVKEALTSRYPRDAYTVTTKLHSGFISTLEDRDKIFNAQREKTGLDFFDYYWIHDINAHSIEVYNRLDCFRWIQDKKAQGLVKHIGFSFHDSPELLDKVLTEHPEFEYVQLQINYLDWESKGIQSRKCYEVARKHNMPILVMEPVKGGTLANVPPEVESMFKAYAPEASVSSWAIRFAASQEGVWKVLSGMSTLEQVLENTALMDNFVPMNEEEKEIVRKAAEIINKNITVPCTGCEYCMPGCPMGIQIPRCFSLYNTDKMELPTKNWTPQGQYYDCLIKDSGKASDCIECHQCEGVCPQHLPITKYLKDVAAYFGK